MHSWAEQEKGKKTRGQAYLVPLRKVACFVDIFQTELNQYQTHISFSVSAHFSNWRRQIDCIRVDEFHMVR